METTGELMKIEDSGGTQNLEDVNFERLVREQFQFLEKMGFSIKNTSSKLICFMKGTIEVEIYHERISNEVGLGIISTGVRYSLSEILRSTDPIAAEGYRDECATTEKDIYNALGRSAQLLFSYGYSILHGDVEALNRLATQRKSFAKEYELDVLASQLRLVAEEAFRRADYVKAFELYTRIHSRLSQSELKKLSIAEERMKG